MKTQSHVQTLLAKPPKKTSRTKASFNLDQNLLEGLRAICEEREITQTVLLEAMLSDLLTLHRTESNQTTRSG